jgi:hypothetical protein
LTAPSSPPTAQRREEPAGDGMLVFVHIRKTAGTTIRHVIYRQYGRRRTRHLRNYFVHAEDSRGMTQSLATNPPADLRVAHGHVLFWPDVRWPAGTQFFTLLRDPIERAISHYFWLRERSEKFRKTFEQAVSDGSIHDNLQTRVLAASMPPFRQTTEGDLEQAIASLDRFAVVGITEQFDESLVLMTRTFGWRRMFVSNANVTRGRKPREEIAPEELEVAEHYNALDLELYRRARERFEEVLATQGEEFDLEVAALSRAKARLKAAPERAAREPLPSTLRGWDPAPDTDPLDLRELLIEAQADLLIRDAELAPKKPAQEEAKPKKTSAASDGRAAALAAAAARAARRRERIQGEIDELQASGNADPERVEALARLADEVHGRQQGFERRLEKAGRRTSGRRRSKAARSNSGDGGAEDDF